ncbi:MAG: NAD-dependent epimerase/dehydratase family protein [Victivallaceae bacterium]|nr:NAD-dependent epimerase/dehydratase family protein [Victivallaceae bacterium]
MKNMDWTKEQVIVYGGGGFLGRYIVEHLLTLNCDRIKTFNRSAAPELAAMGVETISGDLREPLAVINAASKCTTVFHTAAKAGVWGRYKDYYDINVRGTENILAACRTHDIKTLIYTSSPSVAYPPTCDIENINEDEPYPEKYLACYPETKAIAEKKVIGEPNKDLSCVVLRPHLLWGPRDPHLLPRVIDAARRKRLAIIGDGLNRVDMTYIDNAAHAHILAAEYLKCQKKCVRRRYFISDDSPVVLWEWVNNLLKKLDIPPVTRTISYRKAMSIARILEIVYKLLPLGEPPITRFAAGQLAHSHYFDISAAKNDLGYMPVVDYDEAMKATLEWLRS